MSVLPPSHSQRQPSVLHSALEMTSLREELQGSLEATCRGIRDRLALEFQEYRSLFTAELADHLASTAVGMPGEDDVQREYLQQCLGAVEDMVQTHVRDIIAASTELFGSFSRVAVHHQGMAIDRCEHLFHDVVKFTKADGESRLAASRRSSDATAAERVTEAVLSTRQEMATQIEAAQKALTAALSQDELVKLRNEYDSLHRQHTSLTRFIDRIKDTIQHVCKAVGIAAPLTLHDEDTLPDLPLLKSLEERASMLNASHTELVQRRSQLNALEDAHALLKIELSGLKSDLERSAITVKGLQVQLEDSKLSSDDQLDVIKEAREARLGAEDRVRACDDVIRRLKAEISQMKVEVRAAEHSVEIAVAEAQRRMQDTVNMEKLRADRAEKRVTALAQELADAKAGALQECARMQAQVDAVTAAATEAAEASSHEVACLQERVSGLERELTECGPVAVQQATAGVKRTLAHAMAAHATEKATLAAQLHAALTEQVLFALPAETLVMRGSDRFKRSQSAPPVYVSAAPEGRLVRLNDSRRHPRARTHSSLTATLSVLDDDGDGGGDEVVRGERSIVVGGGSSLHGRDGSIACGGDVTDAGDGKLMVMSHDCEGGECKSAVEVLMDDVGVLKLQVLERDQLLSKMTSLMRFYRTKYEDMCAMTGTDTETLQSMAGFAAFKGNSLTPSAATTSRTVRMTPPATQRRDHTASSRSLQRPSSSHSLRSGLRTPHYREHAAPALTLPVGLPLSTFTSTHVRTLHNLKTLRRRTASSSNIAATSDGEYVAYLPELPPQTQHSQHQQRNRVAHAPPSATRYHSDDAFVGRDRAASFGGLDTTSIRQQLKHQSGCH